MTAAFAVALALALTHKPKRKMSPLGIENFPERWAIPATLWRREPIPANKTTSFCIILPFGAIYLCRTEKSKWQFELIFNVTTGSSSSCQLFIKPLCEPVSRTDWAIDKSRVWPGTQPRKQGEMQWSARYHSPLTRYPVASCQLPVTSWQSPGTWQVSSDRDLTGMGWQTKLMARHFPTFVGETLDLYYYYFFFFWPVWVGWVLMRR